MNSLTKRLSNDPSDPLRVLSDPSRIVEEDVVVSLNKSFKKSFDDFWRTVEYVNRY